jgi:hypothetical protein
MTNDSQTASVFLRFVFYFFLFVAFVDFVKHLLSIEYKTQGIYILNRTYFNIKNKAIIATVKIIFEH